MNDGRIPVTIGVTGHRLLAQGDEAAVREKVREALGTLRSACPHSPVRMLSSLAEGADQICAQAALEAGISLWAVLPMPQEAYEKDFSKEALETFRAMLSAAERVLVETGKDPSDRDACYRQAGRYVSDHCHVLMALWDGQGGDPRGCGTADIVAYRLSGIRGGETFHPRMDDILWIPARRPSGEMGTAGDRRWQSVQRLVGKGTVTGETERYNRDVQKEKAAPGEGTGLGNAYAAADALSICNAGKHRRVLVCLTVFDTVFAVAMLLYDHSSMWWMIFVCGIMMLCIAGTVGVSRSREYQRKYLQYRLLAEGIRVQRYLDWTAPGVECAALLPWRWRMDVPWVARALGVLGTGREGEETPETEAEWIRSQKSYHEAKWKKTARQDRLNRRVVKTALALTVTLYLSILVMEFAGRGLAAGNMDTGLGIGKVLLSVVSAATLFTGTYYGKLSLEETAGDHLRMNALYAQMERALEEGTMNADCFRELAREELEENAGWYAYKSLNQTGFSL